MDWGMVSVIVPVYNSEQYLVECVESILSQTYGDFELLLIDDGSSDTSPQICDEFAKRDSRVVVIHKKNEGPSATRNKGIECSKGKYIVFVDSDDVVLPEMLEKMITIMHRYQTDLAICGFERFKTGWRQRFRLSPYSLVIMQSQMELASVYTKAETNMFGVSIWAKMYCAEIIKREHIRFREDIDYEEDCCFNLDYFRHVTTTGVLRDYFYLYRQMDISLSKGYRKETFRYLVNGYRLRSAYLTELGMENRLFKVDGIFFVVIKMTLNKIFDSDLSKTEKLEEYSKVIGYDECQKICDKVLNSKSRLNRMLSRAITKKNANEIHILLSLWRKTVKVKELVKKVVRRGR